MVPITVTSIIILILLNAFLAVRLRRYCAAAYYAQKQLSLRETLEALPDNDLDPSTVKKLPFAVIRRKRKGAT